MNYSIDYFEDVKLDIQTAKEWYKSQKLGLEKQFALEVKKVFSGYRKTLKVMKLDSKI